MSVRFGGNYVVDMLQGSKWITHTQGFLMSVSIWFQAQHWFPWRCYCDCGFHSAVIVNVAA